MIRYLCVARFSCIWSLFSEQFESSTFGSLRFFFFLYLLLIAFRFPVFAYISFFLCTFSSFSCFLGYSYCSGLFALDRSWVGNGKCNRAGSWSSCHGMISKYGRVLGIIWVFSAWADGGYWVVLEEVDACFFRLALLAFATAAV